MRKRRTEGDLADLKFPRHVGIILDGNGRWADKRGLSRSDGHRAGGENLDRLLDYFADLKIPFLSIYAFSTENWKRPKSEVKYLWSLFDEFFTTRINRCAEKNIRIHFSGRLEKLPAAVIKKMKEIVTLTKKNRSFTANFCLNYGSQDEILHACEGLLAERISALRSGKERKALAGVKKKSSKDISTLIPCLR